MIRRGENNRKFERIKKNLNLNIIGGEEDKEKEGGEEIKRLEERMRRMGLERVKKNILKENSNESINEINRDEVKKKFMNWIMEEIK